MGKINSIEQFSDSCRAIKEYIHSDEDHWGTHVAKITVIEDDTMIFNQELSIISLIETNDAFIDIMWPKEVENIYYGKYSSWYQMCEYDNGILKIKCKSKKGKDIIIRIC